jgi:hypothetical protein
VLFVKDGLQAAAPAARSVLYEKRPPEAPSRQGGPVSPLISLTETGRPSPSSDKASSTHLDQDSPPPTYRLCLWRREIDFAADFVGYGIDHAENYRHLPYIGIID